MTASTRTTRIALASSAPELAEHHRIRHEVFVTEQRMFTVSDVDCRDVRPDVLRVLGWHADTPAGTVRLYRLDGTRWQGDRLAVLPEYRASNLGAPLVRYAVATAGEQGGSVMIAHIQPPNVRFFERLGWTVDGDLELYCGHPHVPMSIAL